MRMHRDASYLIDGFVVRTGCSPPRGAAGTRRSNSAKRYGYRNAQATVLAPTGTISFLMDCDTTGIEPDFSLVKFKELVGGGQMTIVNRSVPLALQTLGYTETEIEQIEAYIDEKSTIIGAPGLKDEHLAVFDVAVGERAISHTGHIDMMAAAQPFLSGRSRRRSTCPSRRRSPTSPTPTRRGWKGGLKAWRSTATARRPRRRCAPTPARRPSQGRGGRSAPERRKMPRERESITHKFSIAGHEGYITAGKYEDGALGEIFLTDIGKEGSTLRGLMNAFATSISIGLQYGVPLEVFVQQVQLHALRARRDHRNPEIPFASRCPTTSCAGSRAASSTTPRARGPRDPHPESGAQARLSRRCSPTTPRPANGTTAATGTATAQRPSPSRSPPRR